MRTLSMPEELDDDGNPLGYADLDLVSTGPDTHDLELVDDDVSLDQRCLQRLRWFAGEWFLKADGGIPYFEQVFVRPVDAGLVAVVLSDALLGIDDVESVEVEEIALEQHERELRLLKFRATVEARNANATVEFGL